MMHCRISTIHERIVTIQLDGMADVQGQTGYISPKDELQYHDANWKLTY